MGPQRVCTHCVSSSTALHFGFLEKVSQETWSMLVQPVWLDTGPQASPSFAFHAYSVGARGDLSSRYPRRPFSSPLSNC